ncbi:MAG: hypothetical protein II363_03755 [Clostridia bacterium]|nr:hypothetical protein [Clostridia bacterium]
MTKKQTIGLPLYDRRRLMQLVMEHKLRVLHKQRNPVGITDRGMGQS